MQPLDKNTLFSIFEVGDEEVYKENNVESLLDNPFVLIGMVVRGVENWHLMDILYTRNNLEICVKEGYSSLVAWIQRV